MSPHADSSAEKDLAASLLPNGARGKLLPMPLSPIYSDAVDGIWQRAAASNKNDHKDDWHRHCEVYHSASKSDALEHTQPDNWNIIERCQLRHESKFSKAFYSPNHVNRFHKVVSVTMPIPG